MKKCTEFGLNPPRHTPYYTEYYMQEKIKKPGISDRYSLIGEKNLTH